MAAAESFLHTYVKETIFKYPKIANDSNLQIRYLEQVSGGGA